MTQLGAPRVSLARRVKGSIGRTRSSENSRCVAVWQPAVGTSSIKLPSVGVPVGRLRVCLQRVWRLMGEIAMASFSAGARASEVREADEDLAYEVGTVHDYFWHRRHRARRGGQLVDVAILVSFATVISCLILHH
jgi:hypothetical protein